jgi:hypothetical protein
LETTVTDKTGKISFVAMPGAIAEAFRTGAADANGRLPERMVSDGSGFPCRHCLADIPEGEDMLLLSWQPFESDHAYAESGPVFICERNCEHPEHSETMPPVIANRTHFMIRGYDLQERIVDGSGRMEQTISIAETADVMLQDERIEAVHVRSGTNTCYICRIERV